MKHLGAGMQWCAAVPHFNETMAVSCTTPLLLCTQYSGRGTYVYVDINFALHQSVSRITINITYVQYLYQSTAEESYVYAGYLHEFSSSMHPTVNQTYSI